MKRKRIKKEVLLWFGGILFVILFLFGLTFYYFLRQSVSQSLLDGLHAKAVHIQKHILSDMPTDTVDNSPTIYEYAVVYKEKVVYHSAHFQMKYLKKTGDGEKLFFVDNTDYRDAVYVMEVEKPIEAYIVVVADLISDKSEDFMERLLVILPVLFILLLWIVSRVVNQVLYPIKTLSEEVEHIDVHRLQPLSNKAIEYEETWTLKQAFGRMIERLQDGVSKLSRFNHDVSHELRTPLTVIRGEIETVLRHPRSEAYYRESMETILYETTQIEAIVENLLLLSKYSKETFVQSCEEVDLSEILLEAAERLDTKLQEQGITLDIQRLESISLRCNKQLIGTVFSNLIDNAIKYSPAYSQIQLSLYKEKQKISFVLVDHGIGIPTEELEKITERFYRVDQSRTRQTKGFGLGLSIVKNILDLHHAVLTIDSKLHQGTTVKIQF